jgi:hypothetical protein
VVRERLIAIGIGPERITAVDPGVHGPMPGFADLWVKEVASDLTNEVRGLVAMDATVDGMSLREMPMLVCWDEQSFAAVTEVIPGAGTVTLTVEDAGPFPQATRARAGN